MTAVPEPSVDRCKGDACICHEATIPGPPEPQMCRVCRQPARRDPLTNIWHHEDPAFDTSHRVMRGRAMGVGR